MAPAGTTTGFPAYYMDDQGVALDLIPITGDGVNAPTQIYAPPDPANPYSAFLGFESEAFFYFVRNIFNLRNGRATATFGVEAPFTNGIAQAGQEMVFVRIRLRAPVRDVGTYTFTHPWGVETITVTQADIQAKRGINFTLDVGLVARDFLQAANGKIQRYCKQLTSAPPAGWIGDGASVGTITPGPTGIDYVELKGPARVNLDGRGSNTVKSTQFTVSGRIASALPTALSVQRATCFDVAGTEYIDVFASSDPGATVTVNVVDLVNITAAEYSIAGQTVSVTATTTDVAAALTLKWPLPIGDRGMDETGAIPTVIGPPSLDPPVIVPPATVTATSSMGGSDTRPVQIVP